MLAAVERAREVLPSYGSGAPIRRRDVRTLASHVGLRVHRAVRAMDAPAVLVPPVGGHHRLVFRRDLPSSLVDYVTLHEIGHVLAGDADEIVFLRWVGPWPEAEDVADLFALTGFLDRVDLLHGATWLEDRIRERVPLDEAHWRHRRVPRLARKLRRLHG